MDLRATDESVKVIYKLHDYLRDGRAGESAKALILQNLGLPNSGYAPSDPQDLDRCVSALNTFPFMRVDVMRGVSERWRMVADEWDSLMYAQGKWISSKDRRDWSRITRMLNGEVTGMADDI